MMQRLAVRNYMDKSHVYCIASSSSKEAIVKISLNSDSNKQIQKVDIYESSSSKILVVEPDPENHNNLFVILDDQQIIKLNTEQEGKATTVYARDMSDHHLEDDLADIEKKPWFKDFSICDRALSFEKNTYSMKTKFKFDHERVATETLIEERNLPGTLYSLQLWQLKDKSYKFHCKPLAGVNFVDLLGQTKTKGTDMYFATDDDVLVNTPDGYIWIFDKNGYIVQPHGLRFKHEH